MLGLSVVCVYICTVTAGNLTAITMEGVSRDTATALQGMVAYTVSKASVHLSICTIIYLMFP